MWLKSDPLVFQQCLRSDLEEMMTVLKDSGIVAVSVARDYSESHFEFVWEMKVQCSKCGDRASPLEREHTVWTRGGLLLAGG